MDTSLKVRRNVTETKTTMIVIRTEDTCFGRPRLQGTRLEVYNIISGLEEIATFQEFARDFNLAQHEIKEVVSYCKDLKCQILNATFEKYCSNCILSHLHEGHVSDMSDFFEISPGVFRNKTDSNHFAIGDKEDLQDEFTGRPGWIIADEIWKRIL